jgi:hypothetical protein
MPITITETTEPGGFTGVRLTDAGRDAHLDLDPKEAAELFAALGKVLGGLATQRDVTTELPITDGEAMIGTESVGDNAGRAYLIQPESSGYFDADQATATAAALIFHASS